MLDDPPIPSQRSQPQARSRKARLIRRGMASAVPKALSKKNRLQPLRSAFPTSHRKRTPEEATEPGVPHTYAKRMCGPRAKRDSPQPLTAQGGMKARANTTIPRRAEGPRHPSPGYGSKKCSSGQKARAKSLQLSNTSVKAKRVWRVPHVSLLRRGIRTFTHLKFAGGRTPGAPYIRKADVWASRKARKRRRRATSQPRATPMNRTTTSAKALNRAKARLPSEGHGFSRARTIP
jgi:hypothetical protein